LNKVVETRNKILIKNLVQDHFSLEKKSLELFKQRLFFERPIAKEWKEIIGDSPDLRVRFDITEEFIEQMDTGWRIFLVKFGYFKEEYNVSYKDFNRNIIKVDGQEKRLFKFIKDLHLKKLRETVNHDDIFDIIKDSFSKSLERTLEKISASKAPIGKKMELVVSLNFADWFLCSTSENWSSCLSLQSSYSESFWSGLPGLIGDKNRALIYITDGEKKNFMGIEVDKIINRTWAILTRETNKQPWGSIFLVRPYPNSMDIANVFEKVLLKNEIKHSINKNENIYKGRYYSEAILQKVSRYKSHLSIIYLDKGMVRFSKRGKTKYFPGEYFHYRSGGGCSPRKIVEYDYDDSTGKRTFKRYNDNEAFYDFSDNFSYMVNTGKEIREYIDY
jgi:hypothetical protein